MTTSCFPSKLSHHGRRHTISLLFEYTFFTGRLPPGRWPYAKNGFIHDAPKEGVMMLPAGRRETLGGRDTLGRR